MLPKTTRNSIDTILISIFNSLPERLMRRVLWLLHNNPQLGDKWGYSIRQFHYYEPLPKFSEITKEKILERRSSECINWNLDTQLDLIKKLSDYSVEIHRIDNRHDAESGFNFFNATYPELDAAVYYTLLRELKPSKVIEIGSGYSTQIATKAISKNCQEGKEGKIISVEPYPRQMLTEGTLDVELVTQRVETIDLNFFEQLSAGDILFIDSTHTVKFDSDVCREILEILPTIPSGVWIHIHDIFFPYDYPPKWLIEERRAWSEQYMLEAFLAYNHQFEVTLANHWLSVDYPQEVAKIWSGVLEWTDKYHHCGGFWMRKK
ncbi:MAG: class I SAM-dependent methyltransferase [Cyanobacteria bacterium P01_E01_bin.6]